MDVLLGLLRLLELLLVVSYLHWKKLLHGIVHRFQFSNICLSSNLNSCDSF